MAKSGFASLKAYVENGVLSELFYGIAPPDGVDIQTINIQKLNTELLKGLELLAKQDFAESEKQKIGYFIEFTEDSYKAP